MRLKLRGAGEKDKRILEETPQKSGSGRGAGDNDLCCLLLPFLYFSRLVGSILIIWPACRCRIVCFSLFHFLLRASGSGALVTRDTQRVAVTESNYT